MKTLERQIDGNRIIIKTFETDDNFRLIYHFQSTLESFFISDVLNIHPYPTSRECSMLMLLSLNNQ